MEKLQTISFYTLGCKLNFAESATIGRLAAGAGYHVLDAETEADIAVINTCSVTENADQKCRKLVKKILAQRSQTKVVVIGCFAQLKPRLIASIPGVRLVLGANEKFRLTALLKTIEEDSAAVCFQSDTLTAPFEPSWSTGERTRSFLKVQDGCDYSCSFCTIPLARGQSRNGSIDDICRMAAGIAASGIREIVLTGVNIGDYGKTTGQSFLSLIKSLEQVPGVSRFRISSIEPNLLTAEIIEFVAGSTKFVPHFHMPLQSGCDRLLGLMKRRYKRAVYASRVALIRSLIPYASIGADVITGFPTESDDDFRETCEFVRHLELAYLHVFSYSPRENTVAAGMAGQVKPELTAERSTVLHSISHKLSRAFYESQLGRSFDVMFEADNKAGLLYGLTPNYVKVCMPWTSSFVRKLTPCTLSHIHENGAVLIH